jgi:hypothetical protein
MTDPESQAVTQPAFEELCGEIDDYEPLPTTSTGQPPEVPDEDGERLDAAILAGLVSP